MNKNKIKRILIKKLKLRDIKGKTNNTINLTHHINNSNFHIKNNNINQINNHTKQDQNHHINNNNKIIHNNNICKNKFQMISVVDHFKY